MKNMFRLRHLFIFCVSVSFVFVISAQKTSAQFCTGTLSYLVRNGNGTQMTAEQMEKVIVKEINSKKPLEVKRKEQLYYYVKGLDGNLMTEIQFANPIKVTDICGQIESLTLEYNGETMKLFFGNKDNWTRFEIDSLPFQKGVFRLEKQKIGSQEMPFCDIDSSQESKKTAPKICKVSWSNWTKVGETQ